MLWKCIHTKVICLMYFFEPYKSVSFVTPWTVSLPGSSVHGDSPGKNTGVGSLSHWKRLWCWEGLGAGGEGDNRGWDGWMASSTRRTWVWVNSRSWWWTGRPGVLQFMGSQRVGHDWATFTFTFTFTVLCNISIDNSFYLYFMVEPLLKHMLINLYFSELVLIEG